MNQEELSVSVIVPVYNGEKFLAEALQNIQAQTCQPLEIIVIDDGSTDKTAQIANQFKDSIRYVYQVNRGPSAARNLGIQIAQGNVIAFLDVDDLWSEHKLEIQMTCLKDNPTVEIVQGLIQLMHLQEFPQDGGKLLYEKFEEPYYFINLDSAIYRKSVFEKVGLFDETMKYSEDTDWFFRAWLNDVSKIVLEEVTLFHRRHDANMTWKQNILFWSWPRIFKKHIEFQRKQGRSSITSQKNLASLMKYLGTSNESQFSRQLEQMNLTIISNDFTGMLIYNDIKINHKTPLVYTKLENFCFLKLLNNLQHYLNSPLVMIEKSRYDHVNQQKQEKSFLIGVLDGDIEIQFHDNVTEKTVLDQWQIRVGQINENNIFIIFNLFGKDRQEMQLILQEFESLDHPDKICFTNAQDCSQYRSAIFVPEMIDEEVKHYLNLKKYFDFISWFRRSNGSDSQVYRVFPKNH